MLDIVDKRAAIRRRLQAVREIQAVYMPCVAQLVARASLHTATASGATEAADSGPVATASSTGPVTRSTRRLAGEIDQPEKTCIFLPHHLTVRDLDCCVEGLAEVESRMREGQMRSALDDLRVELHNRSRLLSFKKSNSRHQRENQRSQDKLEKCQGRIKILVAKYRVARAAKLLLCGPGDWEREWRVMADRDVRGLSEMEPQVDDNNEPLSRRNRITEGRRTLSWIWLSADWDEDSAVATAEGMNEGMCSFWVAYRDSPLSVP